MVRSELACKIAAEFPAYSAQDIEKIIEIFFGAIVAQLEAGGRVELRGFGVFTTRTYGSRLGRNPKSGDAVAVAAKSRPYFKAGKAILSRINEKPHIVEAGIEA